MPEATCEVGTDAAPCGLYVDSAGELWTTQGGVPARASVSASEFCTDPDPLAGRKLRIVFTRSAIPLIHRLLSKEHELDLEIASENVGTHGTADGTYSPQTILFRAMQNKLSASVGGWKRLHTFEELQYRLALQTVEGCTFRSRTPEDLDAELGEVFPAYRALTFCGAAPHDVAELIGHLCDPRFYVDPSRPNRESRLTNYMGLVPKIMKNVMAGDRVSDHSAGAVRHRRCASVVRCILDPGCKELDPRSAFVRYGDGCKCVMGTLKAAKHFMRFVRFAWAEETVRKTESAFAGEIFVPAYFFKDPLIAEAYEAWCRG